MQSIVLWTCCLLIVSVEHIGVVFADDKCNGDTSAGMWGNVNPNIFHICDRSTNTTLTMQCPEGRGYFNGFGYHGCIPFDQWPACITLKNRRYVCDSEHMMHPWQTDNPNKFFMCRSEAREPIEVNCEPGKGFVHVPSGDADDDAPALILGCATWEKWRSYMQCENYY